MALASALTLHVATLLAVGSVLPAARIVAEWDPGFSEAELGGELVVDTYGINGLGAYRVRLDDGSSVLAVCIQADLGHSLAVEYATDPTIALPPELGYLLWAYLRPGATATDEQAAAINALAWRYTNAQRRTGGAVWQGGELEVRVLGVGRLTAVEHTIAALHVEATARRGPWQLEDAIVGPGHAAVTLRGPGGPIAGVTVNFTTDGEWAASAVTDGAGVASVVVPDGISAVRAEVTGPGAAVALVAPGSQRLAMPGPAETVTAALTVPTPATTTVPTTTTTTSTTTTTTVPPTSTSTTSTTTTTPPPTTSTSTTTTAPTTTTTAPATTTSTTPPPPAPPASPPPTLPRTGSASRTIGRLGAWLFAAGALAVLVATPRRRAS